VQEAFHGIHEHDDSNSYTHEEIHSDEDNKGICTLDACSKSFFQGTLETTVHEPETRPRDEDMMQYLKYFPTRTQLSLLFDEQLFH
jgi:hypothetical protein